MNPDACCQLSVNQALSAKGQLPAGEAADTSGSGFQSGCCGHHPEPQVPHLFRPAAGSSPSPPDKIGGLCSSWPLATGSHTPLSRPLPPGPPRLSCFVCVYLYPSQPSADDKGSTHVSKKNFRSPSLSPLRLNVWYYVTGQALNVWFINYSMCK